MLLNSKYLILMDNNMRMIVYIPNKGQNVDLNSKRLQKLFCGNV